MAIVFMRPSLIVARGKKPMLGSEKLDIQVRQVLIGLECESDRGGISLMEPVNYTST